MREGELGAPFVAAFVCLAQALSMNARCFITVETRARAICVTGRGPECACVRPEFCSQIREIEFVRLPAPGRGRQARWACVRPVCICGICSVSAHALTDLFTPEARLQPQVWSPVQNNCFFFSSIPSLRVSFVPNRSHARSDTVCDGECVCNQMNKWGFVWPQLSMCLCCEEGLIIKIFFGLFINFSVFTVHEM